MTSSRPGARAMETGDSAVKNCRKRGSVSCRRARRRWSEGWNHTRSPVARTSERERSRIMKSAAEQHSCESQQTAAAQRAAQDGLNPSTEALVRVTDPRHVRCHIERSVDRLSHRICEDHTRLKGDERRAEVVGVATEPGGEPLAGADRLDERAKVGDQ